MIDELYAELRRRLPALRLLDVHTHIGQNDPDGFSMSADGLHAALAEVDATAVVFPMREPDGYARANDGVLEASRLSEGRLHAFCRVDPRQDPVGEMRRCLNRGARGVKLHPASEGFDIDHPGVEAVISVCDERRLPVLIHAGSNVTPLGDHLLALCQRYPQARIILAHAAVSDGETLWKRAADFPNLFFDLSWWDSEVVLDLLHCARAGQLLYASDAPYGPPLAVAVCLLRCFLHAGLTDEEIELVSGGQARRLLAREEPLRVESPQRTRSASPAPAVAAEIRTAMWQVFSGADPQASITRARRLCDTEPADPRIPELIDGLAHRGAGSPFEALAVAMVLALTEPPASSLRQQEAPTWPAQGISRRAHRVAAG